MDARLARQGLAVQKIVLLDGAVVRQLFLVLDDPAAQFVAQVDLAQSSVRPQFHHELVAQIHGRGGFAGPTRQLGTARAEHPVLALSGLTSIGCAAGLDPPGGFHARQFAVNLLVGGVPEIPDGLVKTPRQVVTG